MGSEEVGLHKSILRRGLALAWFTVSWSEGEGLREEILARVCPVGCSRT